MNPGAALAMVVGVILLMGGFLTATFAGVSSTEVRIGSGLMVVGAVLLAGGFFWHAVIA